MYDPMKCPETPVPCRASKHRSKCGNCSNRSCKGVLPPRILTFKSVIYMFIAIVLVVVRDLVGLRKGPLEKLWGEGEFRAA